MFEHGHTKYDFAAVKDADHLIPWRFIMIDLQKFCEKNLCRSVCLDIGLATHRRTLLCERQEALTGFPFRHVEMLLSDPSEDIYALM